MKLGKNKQANEFEKLYFDNYTQLCQSIYRFIRDKDITKDIVQDVFMKYWQKNHELRITETPKAYLYRACINQALNYLKEKDRRETREEIYSKELSESTSSTERPDTQYQADETSKNIQAAIDSLPTACRNAFVLSRYEQKSYKEIASMLNISVNTVEKHIGKALRILRELLKENQ